jgi:glycerophosphoryl diester phosphodiesterase
MLRFPLTCTKEERQMDATSKKVAVVQRIVLVSFRFSNIGMFGWDRPIPMVKEVLEKYGFKIYLYIKVFGEDELWAITSLEETFKFENLMKEPFVAYAASLENSLPLDLITIDSIIREQLPVGYLFFRKKGKSISLRRVNDLIIKKKGTPFLVGEIDHPEGFSHFAAFTVGSKDINVLARVAHELMGKLKCKRWKCYLGVEHVWEGHGEELKEKMHIARFLMKQIKRWSRSIP